MNRIEKITRRHVADRKVKRLDIRRQYRAGRESKAYTLPPQLTTQQKGAHR
jgi:hypothetical protein